MAEVRPFGCVRPAPEFAARVASLPYDVYNRAEAKIAAAKDPLAFINIDRPETQFADNADMYSDEVYARAKEMFEQQAADGVYITEETPCYYIYELTMDGRSQTGVVACSSIDEYLDGTIKKHENTRAEKEADRIRHVDTLSAQTGPIFLAYRGSDAVNAIVGAVKADPQALLYDFTAEDGVRHSVWRIANEDLKARLAQAFDEVPNTYIADGHHRAASAVKVGLKRRGEDPGYTGAEEFNYFLSVLFPDDQLMIMDYNRVVKDLNGLTNEQFLDAVSAAFETERAESRPFRPQRKGEFGMYLDGQWYRLISRKAPTGDPVADLDVSVLQDELLSPVLGIGDPRTDERIDFVGGIRGLGELERRCSLDMKVAFAMYPTSIGELFAVADAGLLMPPKSTWFEPKLRSGLFIHRF